MTFREFTGKNVEEAIRTAMKEYDADLSDLDIEILSQGSRGILGVGSEEARILAAPKSAVAAADTVRLAEVETAPVAAEKDEASEQVEELARADAARRGPRAGRARTSRAERGEASVRGRGRGDRAPRERAPRELGDEPADRTPREPAPFIPAKPFEELSEKERSVLGEARSVLEEMLRLMELPAAVEIGMGAETAKLNVKGENLGVLIGRRGEKLASLQHLVNLIVAKREGQWNRIAVDVENYRGRREEQLRDVADRAAKRVVQSGKIIQLEPMPAIERRIVHLALVENPKVRTQSVGVEPNRRIVVLPASKLD
jgi:spoIIIJ-associated protein